MQVFCELEIGRHFYLRLAPLSLLDIDVADPEDTLGVGEEDLRILRVPLHELRGLLPGPPEERQGVVELALGHVHVTHLMQRLGAAGAGLRAQIFGGQSIEIVEGLLAGPR